MRSQLRPPRQASTFGVPILELPFNLMVENKTKHDLAVFRRYAFIGDDTGLIKKVKIVAKKTEETQEIKYEKLQRKRDTKEAVVKYRRPSTLNEKDNQVYKREETELQFKQLAKYGYQVRDQAIQSLHWATPDSAATTPTILSYVRGKQNVVENFDTDGEVVLQSKQFSDLDLIKGLHSLGTFQDKIIVSSTGQALVTNLSENSEDSQADWKQLRPTNVHKTYLRNDQLAICAKDTTMTLWDVKSQKETWQAKNVPNDELDLQVPIFDTGLTWLDNSHAHSFAVSTGSGCIRTYDTRAGRKCRMNATVLQGEMMLTHLIRSNVNHHQIYTFSQEGIPIVLDMRYNCRQVRRMPGAKGSIRDCAVISGAENAPCELLASVGCDRYLRIYDATKEQQRDTLCGAAYLRQKLNCLLLQESE